MSLENNSGYAPTGDPAKDAFVHTKPSEIKLWALFDFKREAPKARSTHSGTGSSSARIKLKKNLTLMMFGLLHSIAEVLTQPCTNLLITKMGRGHCLRLSSGGTGTTLW